MATIELPAHVPAFQEMESTPARALTFATDIRAVTVGVKDVQGRASDNAAPEWEGDTADAHGHAATRFAARLDGAEAALEKAVTAADLFEQRLSRLSLQRPPIETERKEVNRDTAALQSEIQAATDDSRLAEFQRQAAALVTRASDVSADILRWTTRYDTAESDFIAALQAVDTVEEGEQAAEAPGRPDVAALTRRFDQLRDHPEALAAWWASLTRAQKQALSTEHPHQIGNANGLPSRDRDEANRAAIGSDIDYWEQRDADGQLTGPETSAYENARYIREQIDKYHDQVDPTSGRELLNLLVYKPDAHSGDGGVAISFGDPDTADHVSFNVPGLTSETSSTDGNLDKTWDLHDAARRDLAGTQPGATVASVYWLDYDAPSGNPLNPLDPAGQVDFLRVAGDGKAEVGGARFADFIDGLRASDQGDQAHVTAIGHSYGSTTVGHALQDGAAVDDAILIGSPGQPEATAAALTDADVWVGSKDYDPVSLLGSGDRGGIGALGYDPADDDFGGTRFNTGDGSLRVQDLLSNHTSYFSGESLDNMAHVVTGDDDAVTTQPHRGDPGGGYLTLDELVVASTAASGGELVWDHGGEWVFERGKDAVEIAGDAGDWLLDHSPLGGIL